MSSTIGASSETIMTYNRHRMAMSDELSSEEPNDGLKMQEGKRESSIDIRMERCAASRTTAYLKDGTSTRKVKPITATPMRMFMRMSVRAQSKFA